jgi:hypothetical protein
VLLCGRAERHFRRPVRSAAQLKGNGVTDIFQEVDEEVRREQLKKLWERYGHYAVAACIAIVIGVGAWRGYEWWQIKQAAQSGAAFEQAVTLAEAGKHQDAAAAFAKLAADGTAGYRVLARLRDAAELATTDRNAAIAAYDAIATDSRVGQVVQDLAAVRAAVLLVDSAPYPEILQRLEPATAADRAFRHSAREILALSAWKAGDMSATRRWTEMIMSDPQTPPGPRSRAEMLSELIAASAKG